MPGSAKYGHVRARIILCADNPQLVQRDCSGYGEVNYKNVEADVCILMHDRVARRGVEGGGSQGRKHRKGVIFMGSNISRSE